MRAFFEGIEHLVVEVMDFWPYEALRQIPNWWTSNVVNWVFVIVGMAAMVYWLNQLKIFNDRGEEDKSITSHSYL